MSRSTRPRVPTPDPAPKKGAGAEAGIWGKAGRTAGEGTSEDPDADLMALVADGDASAYRGLIDRHADRLLGFAHRLVGDRASAEDIIQDSFLSVWRSAATWTPQAKVTTWLHRIVRNKALDQIRKRKPTVDPDDVVLTDPYASPDRGLKARQTADVVRLALDALPERQRAAIVLVHYEHLSGADASEALGVSIEALESLLSRGRRALRLALAERRSELLEDSP